MQKIQDQYWNIIKGLGIIAIVLGHDGSPLVSFVYMYHLALFYFVSGYFVKQKYIENPGLLLLQRIKSLYWPFVKYGLGFLVLHNILYNLHVYDSANSVQRFSLHNYIIMANDIIILINTEQLAGATWFLISLLATIIAFSLIMHICIKYFRKYYIIPSVAIFFILYVFGFLLVQKHVQLSYYFDINFVILPIVYCGYLLQVSKKKVFMNWALAALCVLFLYYISHKYGFISLAGLNFGSPWLFLLCSFSGIYFNMFIATIIDKYRIIGNMFAYIGKYSLAIMALQFLSFKLVSLIYILINNAPISLLADFPAIPSIQGWWIPYTIAGVLCPLILCALEDKLKSLIFDIHASVRTRFKMEW